MLKHGLTTDAIPLARDLGRHATRLNSKARAAGVTLLRLYIDLTRFHVFLYRFGKRSYSILFRKGSALSIAWF